MTLLATLFPSLYIIPEELTLRDNSIYTVVGYGLFISLVFISIAKLYKTNLYNVLLFSNLKIKGIHRFLAENYSLNRPESYFLILNFFLSSSVLLYILFDFPEINFNYTSFFIAFFPVLYFLFSIISVLFSSILFGEYTTINQLIIFRIVGAQFLGVIYMVIGGVWFFTNLSQNSFLFVVVIVTIFEFIIRIAKGLVSVLQKNVAWYYIILYFCTLEILPLVILLYFFKGFSG